jgi:hypothetical protein
MLKNKAKRSVNPEIINNRFRRAILRIELKKLHNIFILTWCKI